MDFNQFKENAEDAAERRTKAREIAKAKSAQSKKMSGERSKGAAMAAKQAATKRLDRADPRGAETRARHAEIMDR